ncbi:MAG: hypothetical protein AB6733_20660 [Clostridiaceae bacterium]
MSYEKNKKFFIVYTLIILILLVFRLGFQGYLNDFWQGVTLLAIVVLSFIELILMKILK